MEVRVLGPLQVLGRGGEPVEIAAPKERGLLAILALRAGRVVSVDDLVDGLWGERPPATARKTLQVYVSRLRKVLGTDAIRTRPSGYLFSSSPDRVDAIRLEELVSTARRAMGEDDFVRAQELFDEALSLWRGEPLPDLESDLGRAETVRLQELRTAAVEDRIEARLALGHHEALVPELEGLVGRHPFRERLWGQLMVALYRCGRQSDALDAYRRAREFLVEELGVEPSHALRDLERDVLEQDPALDVPVRSADPEAVPSSLPVERSTFIGRAREIARVLELLAEYRLVTLTGMGGAGKTRLALQVGARELDGRRDGVFFVDLAPLTDPDLVPRTVADGVGLDFGGVLAGRGSRSTADLLVDALVRSTCLLVLDNCEHLLDASADLTDRILASCPRVRVLATSREPLGVEGEQVYRVPPLSVPEEGGGGEPSEALDLFVERAKGADPEFELTPDGAPAVEQVCRDLDGIPLAIEFAAARVAHLTPQAIAERLDDRFRLLAGGRRRVRRQQTLEATLDWSYELLDEREQRLLARLAVFSGSFGLAMAEEVCSGEGIEGAAVLDLLGSLVDKSLVVAEAADGEPRYRLLETVRGYAEARLHEVGEAETYRSKHRDAYLAWLEEHPWEDYFFDPDLSAALVRELDNLRAALRWSQAQERHDLVGRLAARGLMLWGPIEGYGEEGHRWLSWALEEPEILDRAERAACFVALTYASMTLSEPEQEDYAARALEFAGEVPGGVLVLALGLRAMGTSVRAIIARDPDAAREARALAEEGVRTARTVGEPWPFVASTYHGFTVLNLGDVEAAERSYAVAERAGSRSVLHDVVASELSTCRTILGDAEDALEAAQRAIRGRPSSRRTRPSIRLTAALAEAHLGRLSDAAANLETAIRLASSGRVFLEANECMVYAAPVAFEMGDPRRASRLLAAAVHVGGAREAGIPFRSPASFALYRDYLPRIREALGPEEARRHRDEGRAMTEEEALAEALEVAHGLREDGPGDIVRPQEPTAPVAPRPRSR